MADYKITEAEEKDHEEILDFLNEHFIPHEPINAAINLCEKGYRYIFVHFKTCSDLTLI